MAAHLVALIYRVGICCGLLLAYMTLGAPSGQARPSRAGLSAHTFYPISAATYNNWCPDPSSDTCSPPARVTRFPAHVQ